MLHKNYHHSMKILLLGDYSNVHATLGAGLRTLGHDVTVASDGDGWKNYPRDVDLLRPSLGKISSIGYLLRLERTVRSFRGYDVVQLIGPDFLPLKAERIGRYYRMLRQHNKRVFLGAFGMDRYYVEACLDCKTFRYSDFNFGDQLRQSGENTQFIADWLHGAKGKLNELIANDCDGIIAGLYEYYAAYKKVFPEKLRFIPFPIQTPTTKHEEETTKHLEQTPKHLEEKPSAPDTPIRFFIGIMRGRSVYKGTDVMLRALLRAKEKYGNLIEVVQVENVPFEEYRKLLKKSDVLLDQLYSYTPAMNALEAMSQGLIVVGGGEPENYEVLGEDTLRPIINVQPNEESVFEALCHLVEHRENIPTLKRESLEYIRRHHDYIKVAQQYLDYWTAR